MTTLSKEPKIASVFADVCGNTFLIFNCLEKKFNDQEWEDLKERIWTILEEVPVDDALLLRKVKEEKQTVKLRMHVLEPDRTEADFCGNGARTVGRYLSWKYKTTLQRFFLVSCRGVHGFKEGNKGCAIELGEALLSSEKLVFNFCQTDYTFQFVDCVEPHLVTTDFFDKEVLLKVGAYINLRYKKKYPKGINVNCFRCVDKQVLEVLTYERGIYTVTKACGTGSLACMRVAIDQEYVTSNLTMIIRVLGGEIKIDQINNVFWLESLVVLKLWEDGTVEI